MPVTVPLDALSTGYFLQAGYRAPEDRDCHLPFAEAVCRTGALANLEDLRGEWPKAGVADGQSSLPGGVFLSCLPVSLRGLPRAG